MCTDFRGGFHLQPVQNSPQGHLGHVSPPCSFTPLLDVPVDSYISRSVRSRSLSPSPSIGSVRTDSDYSTHNGRRSPEPPNRRENGGLRHDEASLLLLSDRGDMGPERGRSPVRKADHGRARRGASPESMDSRSRKQENYTEVSIRVPSQRQLRTPLADVFQLQKDNSPTIGRGSSQRLNSPQRSSDLQPAEYETKTLTITKSRPSLGEFKRNLPISTKNKCTIQHFFNSLCMIHNLSRH